MRRKSCVQHRLKFPAKRGGRRRNSGRKPKGREAGVAHRARESFDRENANHVTMKVVGGLPSLRTPEAFAVIERALREAKDRFGCAFNQFSVQSNHIHLIIEATSPEALAQGVKGLAVRIARGLNRLWGRTGTLWRDRYHHVVIRSARQMKNVLRYVLRNCERHGVTHVGTPDPYSSAVYFFWFTDFCPNAAAVFAKELPISLPHSELQRERSKTHGHFAVSAKAA